MLDRSHDQPLEFGHNICNGISDKGQHSDLTATSPENYSDLVNRIIHLHFRLGSRGRHLELGPLCAILKFSLHEYVGVVDDAVDTLLRADPHRPRNDCATEEDAVFVLVGEFCELCEGMLASDCLHRDIEEFNFRTLREIPHTVRLHLLDESHMVGMNVPDIVCGELSSLGIDGELGIPFGFAGCPLLVEMPDRKFPRYVIESRPKVLYYVRRDERPVNGNISDSLKRDLDGVRIRIELLHKVQRVLTRPAKDLGFKFLKVQIGTINLLPGSIERGDHDEQA
jgi:hypothetical protein